MKINLLSLKIKMNKKKDINIKSQYYDPHVHLECNYFNQSIPYNEAEMKAIEQEKLRNLYEENKKLKNLEYIKKYKNTALLKEEEKRIKNAEEEMIRKKEQKEQLQKTINYTKEVHDKNMKKFGNTKSKTITKESNDDKNNQLNDNNNKDSSSENFIPKKRYLSNTINNNIIINDNKEKYILKKSHSKEKETEKIILNNDVVDLRYTLEEQINKELANKNKIQNNAEIFTQIDDKINTIKRFRNNGILPVQEITKKSCEKNIKKEKKNKKCISEFEKRRFNKALKNILTERLGEHHIYIQNICSCGNLQKQLTAIVERGNLTVFALTEVECANNCIFYKNKKAYLKSINDVLKSIKSIAYENFHNKHKD